MKSWKHDTRTREPATRRSAGKLRSLRCVAGVLPLAVVVFVVLGACKGKQSRAREARARDAGEVGFEAARADPSLRAEYLRQVVDKAGPRIPDSLVAVEYAGPERLAELGTRGYLEANAEPAFVTIGEGTRTAPPFEGGQRSRIIVLPTAFDDEHAANEIVFLLGLLDHELVHVDQGMHGLRHELLTKDFFRSLDASVAERLYDTMAELLAYRNELTASRQYALPAAYYRDAMGAYLTYYLRLFAADLAIPERVRHQLMIEMFEKWMPEQEKLFEVVDGRWFFETPEARYEVPAGVVRELEKRFPAEPPR